jgi:hypothetical protein
MDSAAADTGSATKAFALTAGIRVGAFSATRQPAMTFAAVVRCDVEVSGNNGVGIGGTIDRRLTWLAERQRQRRVGSRQE